MIKNKEVTSVNCGEGVTRKLLVHDGSLMVTEVVFKKGAKGDVHTHPHEQISYISEGSFEYELEGKTYIMEKGDSIYVAPNLPHGTVAREDNSVIVDVFTPQRQDFIDAGK